MAPDPAQGVADPPPRIGFLSLRPVPALLATDWTLALAAYVVALVVRAALVHVHPYTAEAAHYTLAKGLWATAPPVAALDGVRPSWAWLFWQRPLFSLLLSPGAALSFQAYRWLHVLVTSLIPLLGVVLLRSLGVPRWLAAGAAAILGFHPALVPWNVLVLPDSLMTVLFLGALVAAQRGRPVASAVLCLAAGWTKEVAAVGTLALLLLALWKETDGSRARLYPLALGRQATLYLVALLATFIPLAYSLGLPWARFPGWDLGGDGNVLLERIFVALVLAPIPLLALASPTSRRLAVVSIAWSSFFVVYHFAIGKAVEIWYYVAPVTMALLAIAAALAAFWQNRPRAGWPAAATAAVAAVLLMQVVVPDSAAAQKAVLTPLSHQGQWDLAQVVAYETRREQGLYDVMARAPDAPTGSWVAVDVDWSFLAYPIGSHAGQVLVSYTTGVTRLAGADQLAKAVESANATIVDVHDGPADQLNVALRSVYADCIAARSEAYVLILGQRCPGRADALRGSTGP